MKIRVSYAELKSGPGYNNQRAEAEIELEVRGDIEKTYDQAWALVKRQVKAILNPEIKQPPIDDGLPF
jgi:metal-dependent amidase/aminoacylase/carboxypeptidase family protein